MMLDQLADVKYYEERRKFYQTQMLLYKNMRDLKIVHAFKAGNKQPDIGHVCGLSGSTIKHIIAARKQENFK
jgi:hypothetical protein